MTSQYSNFRCWLSTVSIPIHAEREKHSLGHEHTLPKQPLRSNHRSYFDTHVETTQEF